MEYPDEYKHLRDLICDVKSLITDSDDKDKVSAIVDSLIDHHNDFNHVDDEYPYRYLDTEVHAIIEDCGFGGYLANVRCRPSSEHRIHILAKLGQLMTKQLYTVKWCVENFEQEK